MARASPDREPAAEPAPSAPEGVAAASGARTPQEAVLALQRSYGNAAVGRLLRSPSAQMLRRSARLSRQAVSEEDPSTLDVEPLDVPRRIPSPGEGGGPPPKGGPVQIDRYDVIITSATGPDLRPQGEYDWGVTYQLPFPADVDGWMIQELFSESSSGSPGSHFWECWKVSAGNRGPGDRSDPRYDDHYYWKYNVGAIRDRAGWLRHVGVIRFYPGPLPSEFGADEGTFHQTQQKPSGWTGKGTRHDAYSEWDARRNGFVGYAGSTEVRQGDHVTFRPR
jgi:hypothetical protein